jgi:hypothetical protein
VHLLRDIFGLPRTDNPFYPDADSLKFKLTIDGEVVMFRLDESSGIVTRQYYPRKKWTICPIDEVAEHVGKLDEMKAWYADIRKRNQNDRRIARQQERQQEKQKQDEQNGGLSS